MIPATQEWEGTWEELRKHEGDFAGRRLRVQVLPITAGTDDPRLRALEEIEARVRTMNPQPDSRDYLREGRAGGMFGETQPGE